MPEDEFLDARVNAELQEALIEPEGPEQDEQDPAIDDAVREILRDFKEGVEALQFQRQLKESGAGAHRSTKSVSLCKASGPSVDVGEREPEIRAQTILCW